MENDPNRVGMCYAMQYKFCTFQGKKMYGMLLSFENTSGGNEGDAAAADDDDGERSAINVIQIMGWDPRNNHSTTSWESSGGWTWNPTDTFINILIKALAEWKNSKYVGVTAKLQGKSSTKRWYSLYVQGK